MLVRCPHEEKVVSDGLCWTCFVRRTVRKISPGFYSRQVWKWNERDFIDYMYGRYLGIWFDVELDDPLPQLREIFRLEERRYRGRVLQQQYERLMTIVNFLDNFAKEKFGKTGERPGEGC